MSTAGQLRGELVRAALELRAEGLLAASLGNLSARDGAGVLITPSALPYEEMEAGDVVRIGLDGAVIEGEREPSSEWQVHTAIYTARPEAQAVIHTHGTHAIAWSFLGDELDTGTEELELYAGGPVRTTPQEAAAGSDELARLCVEALESRRAALIARHGAVVLGDTLAGAVGTSIVVERQARLAVVLRGLGL